MKKKDKQELTNYFKQMLDILIVNDCTCAIHTEMYCYNECEKIASSVNCQECKSRRKIKADIIFENAAEDFRAYYVIGRKDRRKYITTINNYEDILKELTFLNTAYVGNMDRSDAQYHRKIGSLESYAKEFFIKITEDCFPMINKDILPIRFHLFLKDWKEYATNQLCTLGNYHKYSNQSIINIYEVRSLEIEKLKLNIRHEIIHYCLDHSDLINGDSTGVFHALCKLYDAGAYVEMDEHQQKIYDTFLKVYDNWEHIKTVYEKKDLTKTNYVQVLINMAGNKNIEIQTQFAKWDLLGLKEVS